MLFITKNVYKEMIQQLAYKVTRKKDKDMNVDIFEKVMNERARIQQDTQDNDYIGIEICCKETIDIIKEDISGFIIFL